MPRLSSAIEQSATAGSALPEPPAGGTEPLRVDRLAAYDRALAGLQRHLLPLLQTDLGDVAARTGLPAETLRKRKRDLERGARSLPGVDALVAIATAYGWSLDRVFDGASETPMCSTPAAAEARAVAPILRAHIAQVVRSTVLRSRPWALDTVLGTDPDELLERFERQTAEQVYNLTIDRERAQQREREEDWTCAKAHLAGTAIVERVACDCATMAPWSEALVARLRHAVEQGRYDFMQGRFVFPPVPVRVTDPWTLARGFAPVIQVVLPLVGRRIGEALDVAWEVTSAEVETARDALTRGAGRGAGLRACSLDEVLAAYEHLRERRLHRPGATQSWAVISEAAGRGDHSFLYDEWAVHDLFTAFCASVGLVWHPSTQHFTLGTIGHGSFKERLAAHPRYAQLTVVPWRVER